MAKCHLISARLITMDRLEVVLLFGCCYRRSAFSLLGLHAYVSSCLKEVDAREFSTLYVLFLSTKFEDRMVTVGQSLRTDSLNLCRLSLIVCVSSSGIGVRAHIEAYVGIICSKDQSGEEARDSDLNDKCNRNDNNHPFF